MQPLAGIHEAGTIRQDVGMACGKLRMLGGLREGLILEDPDILNVERGM